MCIRDSIYGGLSFSLRDEAEFQKLAEKIDQSETISQLRYNQFNSAILRLPDASVGGLYHKKVLMPFGEYMPLGDIWPELYSLSPHTGNFSAGEESGLFVVSEEKDKEVLASMSVCYEDMVPSLARQAVDNSGGEANLLINLTNDAWYGDSAAPRQHHLLALWRAIELRKTFIRSTNTCLLYTSPSPRDATLSRMPSSA